MFLDFILNPMERDESILMVRLNIISNTLPNNIPDLYIRIGELFIYYSLTLLIQDIRQLKKIPS